MSNEFNVSCCLTEQEERINANKNLESPRARTNRLLAKFRDQKPRIDAQRAVLFTESMQQTEMLPLSLRWAKAMEHIMENIKVEIQQDELIVGTCGGCGRYSILYPELRGGWYEKGLPATQKKEAYLISDETIAEINEKVVPYWKGKTAHEYYLASLPPETKDMIYGDSDYGATGLMQDNSNVQGTLNWSGEYKRIIDEGLQAYIAEIENEINKIKDITNVNLYDKLPFLEAELIVAKSLIKLAHRYADKAEQMAAEEADPVRKKELETIANNCRWVPEKPARNFWEAVQSQWFVQMGYKFEALNSGGIGLGRFDQYMYPTYIAGIKNGELTDEKALEILECLWFKIAASVQFNATDAGNYWEGYAHFENITIGGQTSDGRDATNELTYLILRAKKEFPLHYPEVSLRVHSGTPDKLLVSAAELVKIGAGFPKFFNDEEIIPILMDGGIKLKDARNYVSCGCTEIRVTNIDTYMPLGGNINLASCLEMAMNDGYVHYGENYRQLIVPSIAAKDIKTYEDLFKNFQECVDFFVVHFYKRQTALELTNKACIAAPFASMLQECCYKSMTDIHQPFAGKEYGAVYKDTGNCNFNGFGTVAESLAAIKKLIFEDKLLTLDELKKALEANFEGYEPIQQMLLNAPKYGNNDPFADKIACELDKMLSSLVYKYTTPYGRKGCKYVPVTSHVGMGKKVGATPNGRKAGVSLSEGISPTQGSDTHGPLATLTSIANAKSRIYSNSYSRLLNIKLSPQVLQGEKGIRDLVNFIRSWCDLKLWHMQIGVVNRETLINAQKDPNKYHNLIVRVAGYSAYFVELSPGMQDEIIARTEHDNF